MRTRPRAPTTTPGAGCRRSSTSELARSALAERRQGRTRAGRNETVRKRAVRDDLERPGVCPGRCPRREPETVAHCDDRPARGQVALEDRPAVRAQLDRAPDSFDLYRAKQRSAHREVHRIVALRAGRYDESRAAGDLRK